MLESGFESAACALCSSRMVRGFHAGDVHLNLVPPIRVVVCTSCGLKFLSPRPDAQTRDELHRGSLPPQLQPYATGPADYADASKRRSNVVERRVSQLRRDWEAAKTASPWRILDVGASSGVFVKAARAQGFECDGLEPSETGRLAAAREGIELHAGQAEKLPFPGESYDVVHAHHVFEHFVDPLAAARECHRVLKPGGFLLIEVPNQLENIMFVRDRFLRRIPMRRRSIRSIHHLWFFSKPTLNELFVRAGFRNIEVHDRYAWTASGRRRLLSEATRLLGRLRYGGDLIEARGYK